MKSKSTFNLLTIISFVLILANACKKDSDDFKPSCDGSTPTYDADIANIINNNCTNLACHGSGSANGDWTSYDGMDASVIFDNGNFEKQVLIDMTMPQGAATLSESQLNAIQCWVDNGFPEN